MLAEKDCEQRIIGSCHPGNRIYCISKESSISLHNWKDFLLIMWARFFFLPSIKSMWNNVSCCAKAEQCGVVQRNAQTQHDRFCCNFGCWSKHWQIQDLPEPSVPWLYQQCIRCWQVFVNTHLSLPAHQEPSNCFWYWQLLKDVDEHCSNNYCHSEAFKFV